MSVEEVDELDFRLFIELYDIYKSDFDLELQMTKNSITYAQLNSDQQANHGMENTISW